MPSRRVHYPDASPARNRLSAANLQQIPEAQYHLGVDRWTDLPDGLNYPDRHGESRGRHASGAARYDGGEGRYGGSEASTYGGSAYSIEREMRYYCEPRYAFGRYLGGRGFMR
jgi:hypothetical protein